MLLISRVGFWFEVLLDKMLLKVVLRFSDFETTNLDGELVEKNIVAVDIMIFVCVLDCEAEMFTFCVRVCTGIRLSMLF